jgi:peptidoglycan/xylan/chitin deacetylase (PgdA/CDA1 family)
MTHRTLFHNAKFGGSIITLLVVSISSISMSPDTLAGAYAQDSTDDSSGDSNRFVMLNFDDSHRSQIEYAMPVLDKYGFKATFFHVCGWIGNDDWQQIARLKQNGMDIQAHTINHPDLNTVSKEALKAEVEGSKQCLLNHGYNTTIFAYPFGVGSHNPTVIDMVAQNFELARDSENQPLTFLQCDEVSLTINSEVPTDDSSQSDCGTYNDDGELQSENRYSINSWSHNHIEGPWSYDTQSCMDNTCSFYNNDQMFERFVSAVNRQDEYNNDGTIRAIPIIVYHSFTPLSDVSDSKDPVETSLNLFEREMKYLHDNGFKVLTMADLGYDENNNVLYLKNNNTSG